MKRNKVSSTYYLAIGLVLFPIGLLMLFRQPSLIDLMSNIMPSTQTVEIFGLILQFFGEGLICFGIIGAISSKVTANTDYNRQILIAGATRNMQEQTALVTGIKKSFDDQIAQLHAKLNQVQGSRMYAPISALPSKCRFCGAKIEQGHFCPSCGKAN